MKFFSLFIAVAFFQYNSFAQKVTIEDTIKAIGLYAEATVTNQTNYYSMQLGKHVLSYQNNAKGASYIAFSSSADSLQNKPNGKIKNGLITLNLPKGKDTTQSKKVKLYISTYRDTLTTHIAFYVNTSNANKWKYIGKIISADTTWSTTVKFNKGVKDTGFGFNNIWLQTQKRVGWLPLYPNLNNTKPIMRPFSNVDSTAQNITDLKLLKDSLKTKATLYKGLYYTILKKGTGKKVMLTDTVSVSYKGTVFASGRIFDDSKGEVIEFPLNQLIKGWQTGLPLCNVGGKIRLYLPSGESYGIRNITDIIVPNSILVFDIDVKKSKPKVK